MKINLLISFILASSIFIARESDKKTIALWVFDEQAQLYPSCVLSDISKNAYPLVLGPGGNIVEGKFGNALEASEQPEVELPISESTLFGIVPTPKAEGRTVEPMNWSNANFCALMTGGENHLRKQVGFVQPTKTKLNLGDFDWTVEFWFNKSITANGEGVIFEIGEGPRGENNRTTTLLINTGADKFILRNSKSNAEISIPSDMKENVWQHFAFTYDSADNQIKHYADGKLQPLPGKKEIQQLDVGDEDYMSVGRDGLWEKPMPGKLDELRFSSEIIYISDFTPPSSFSYIFDGSLPEVKLKKGLPLLFDDKNETTSPIDLGTRKHLFIDDALIQKLGDAEFIPNPPKSMERVIENIEGSYRKHLNVVEDENGLLRLYNSVEDDYMAVRISKDGINWEIPELPNGNYQGNTNIVIHEPTGMGQVFIDPNAPPHQKWKFISGFHDRGVFMYTSPDGYNFERVPIAVLPFWAGSQSQIFYDEQQQKYISYHRADFARGVGGSTQREFVMATTKNLLKPWDFEPSTQQEGWELAKRKRVKNVLPFYMDNGPLTPGGFAFEYPAIFTPDDDLDPVDVDIYVSKAMKYPWAPDVYVAFPTVYFHYEKTSPEERVALADIKYNRGSGPLETQLSVSRDAVNWKRYPRPVYVGIGNFEGRDVHTTYMAVGMVKRGNEIWQYFFGETQYHSSHFSDNAGRGVYRVVQRMDGFVSIDSPYEKEVTVTTKPLVFEGNRLTLNIDTDATGYAQVGFVDENGDPIDGFSVDDCIYINGDFIDTEVEWMEKGKDISELEGKTVQVVFRMRGSKLYAMQFVNK